MSRLIFYLNLHLLDLRITLMMISMRNASPGNYDA